MFEIAIVFDKFLKFSDNIDITILSCCEPINMGSSRYKTRRIETIKNEFIKIEVWNN